MHAAKKLENCAVWRSHGDNQFRCFIPRLRHVGPNEVKVNLVDGGEQTISTKNVMIATGSDVSTVPGLNIDEKKYASTASCSPELRIAYIELHKICLYAELLRVFAPWQFSCWLSSAFVEIVVATAS